MASSSKAEVLKLGVSLIGLTFLVLTSTLAGPEAAASGEALVSPPEIILKTQKAPDYPPAALAGRFGGTVTVEATVLKDGSVGGVKVVECSNPNLGFEQAVTDAIRQWRFEPANRQGEPMDYTMRFRLNFNGTDPSGGRSPRVSAGTFSEAPLQPTRDSSVSSSSSPRSGDR